MGETTDYLQYRQGSGKWVPLEMIEALVNHNDNARSFFQIANRIAIELGTDALGTNFGGFAETTHNMLKRWHEVTNTARAMLAAAPQQQGTDNEPPQDNKANAASSTAQLAPSSGGLPNTSGPASGSPDGPPSEKR